MDFKLLLIAGHGKNKNGSYDPGATAAEYEEAIMNRELVSLIKYAADRHGIDCAVAPDRNHYDFFKNNGAMDFKPYNYVLEIHFNASAKQDLSGDGVMKGTMFYISESETGHSVEDKILDKLYAIGAKKAWDGVVVAQRQWPNGLMVQEKVREQGVSHAVLETCFITDFDDMNWYLTNKIKIANAIVEGIVEGFKLKSPSQEEFKPYMVKVTDSALKIRSGPGTNFSVMGKITDRGCYTIVEEHTGVGASKWGRLLSGAGWISLDYTKRLD